MGITQAESYQKFNRGFWIGDALSRLDKVLQRSYSYQEDGGTYSFDAPAGDIEGATSRSYTATDYTNAWGTIPYVNYGQPDAAHTPTVTGWSLSTDAFGKANKSFLDQQYQSDVWGNVGRTVLQYSRSYSWSSNEVVLGTESDGNLFE